MKNRVPIGEVAKFINGRAFKPSEWESNGLPIIRIQNLTGSRGVVNYFNGEYEGKHHVKRGDILISWSASLGAYKWDGEEALLNQHIFKVVPNEEIIDKGYLFYASQNAIEEMLLKVHGSTMQHITKDPFLQTEIPLPTLPEQKRIAAILDKADRLRRLRRYARKLSDTFLHSVFLEMFETYLAGKTEYSFGDILEEPLRNGIFEKNEKYGSGIPVIWVDNLYHTISIAINGLRRVDVGEDTLEKYEVYEGDLLFTRSSLVREGIGQINIVPELSERTMFECHTIRSRVRKDLTNPFYILGLYRSPYGKRAILGRSKTATMTTISQTDMLDLPVPLPPLSLQRKYAEIVKGIEKLSGTQSESDRQIEQLFQSLLHRAFRGDA